MRHVRILERLAHDPPFGLSLHDALRSARQRPDQITPREVALEVIHRLEDGAAQAFAQPLPLLRRVVATTGRIHVEGEAFMPPRGLKRRLPEADYRVRLSHPSFEPASLVLHLPVGLPIAEEPRSPPPAKGDAYAALLAERRIEVTLRPGANYPLPPTDAPADRSLLVVAGSFDDPFDGTVWLVRPQTPEPGGVAEPGAAGAARGFVLWTALPRGEALPDGELDLVLRRGTGAVGTFTYAVDLTVDRPGARATLVRPPRGTGRVQPPSLTLLML